MTWLASHIQPRWRWLALNLAALAIFVYVITQGSDWRTTEGFDSMMESGKWGIRFLLISLTMTPLYTYLRWSSALKLRKSAGLWAFAFGAAHLTLYALETWQPLRIHEVNGTPWSWLSWPFQLHIAVGLLAFGILTALALTSNKWAMRQLGKKWKRLHRLVYCAGIGVIVHVLLASAVSKKIMVRDPNVVTETSVYLGALAILLIVRIPQVRGHLLKLVAQPRPERHPVRPIAPRVLPNYTPASLPAQLPALMPDDHANEVMPQEAEPMPVREHEPSF